MTKYAFTVLIPLNRVIVIECVRDFRNFNSYSLNPLKSGHCYWIKIITVAHTKGGGLNPLKSGHCYWIHYLQSVWWTSCWRWVLIPLNRVIVIESLLLTKYMTSQLQSLNPLKSGHCYWIAIIWLFFDGIIFLYFLNTPNLSIFV